MEMDVIKSHARRKLLVKVSSILSINFFEKQWMRNEVGGVSEYLLSMEEHGDGQFNQSQL